MKTVIHVEKKAQAEALLQSFRIKEKGRFYYELEGSEQFPNGATVVWCPVFYLYGVLLELLNIKEDELTEVNRITTIYRGTPLPKLLTLERPLNEVDLEQAFGADFTEEWALILADTLQILKEASTIIYSSDCIASESNFRLFYDLAQSNAEVIPYTVHSLLPEEIERGWKQVRQTEKGFVKRWDVTDTNSYATIFNFLQQKTCS